METNWHRKKQHRFVSRKSSQKLSSIHFANFKAQPSLDGPRLPTRNELSIHHAVHNLGKRQERPDPLLLRIPHAVLDLARDRNNPILCSETNCIHQNQRNFGKGEDRVIYASRTVLVKSACFSACLHHSILSCATSIHSCEMSSLWSASMLGLHLAIHDSHLRTCTCLLCPCLPLPNLSSCCFSQADPLQIRIFFAGRLSLMRATWPAHRKRLCESL